LPDIADVFDSKTSLFNLCDWLLPEKIQVQQMNEIFISIRIVKRDSKIIKLASSTWIQSLISKL
jgi:hypothetical protein